MVLKYLTPTILLSTLFALTFWHPIMSATAVANQQQRNVVAFVNVNVIPMDTERVLENQTVIVEDDRLTTIGSADEVAVPDGAEVVEGNGAYLMPGLADMHMHLQADSAYSDPEQMLLFLSQGATTIRVLGAAPEVYPWRERIVSGELIGPTLYTMGRTIIGNDRDEIGISLYLTLFNGMRLVLPLLLGGLLLLLFKQLRSPQIALVGGGALLLVGLVLMLIKTPPFMILANFFDAPQSFLTESSAQTTTEVRRQREWDVDGVKVYDGLTEEQFLAAVAEANEQNLYVTGHLLNYSPLDLQLTSGLDEIAHIDELLSHHWIGYNLGNDPDPAHAESFDFPLDYAAIPQTVALVAENDLAVVSNMSTDEAMAHLILDLEGTLAHPEYEIARPDLVAAWRKGGRHTTVFADAGEQRRDVEMPFYKTLLKALHDAGAIILLGTDSGGEVPEGSIPSHIHREVELLVEAGFSNYDALAAGTKNAGAIVERMGRDGSFGTITAGQRADIILLPQNPLENVSHTRERLGVMARGQWFTQAELDRLVDKYLATSSFSHGGGE